MQREKLSTNATQVTVGATSKTLSQLILTADAAQVIPNGINAIELCAEGDIRYSVCSTPTAAVGMTIASGQTRLLRGVHPSNLNLIAGGNVKCNIQIGYTSRD